MSQLSMIATLHHELVSLGKLRKEKVCHLAAIRLQSLPLVSPKETQDVEKQDTCGGLYQGHQNKPCTKVTDEEPHTKVISGTD